MPRAALRRPLHLRNFGFHDELVSRVDVDGVELLGVDLEFLGGVRHAGVPALVQVEESHLAGRQADLKVLMSAHHQSVLH